jgi:hypothetical protein
MLWTKEWRLKELPLRILRHTPNICPEEMNIRKNPPRGYRIFRTTFRSIISWTWSAGAYHPRILVKWCRWKKPWPILSYCFSMRFKSRINTLSNKCTSSKNTHDIHKLHVSASRCCHQGVITTICITQSASMCFVRSYKHNTHRTVYLDDIVVGHTESQPMFVYTTHKHKWN